MPYSVPVPGDKQIDIWVSAESTNLVKVTFKFPGLAEPQEIIGRAEIAGQPQKIGSRLIRRGDDFLVEFKIQESTDDGRTWSNEYRLDSDTGTDESYDTVTRWVYRSSRVASIEFSWGRVAQPSIRQGTGYATLLLKKIDLQRLNESNDIDEMYVLTTVTFPEDNLRRIERRHPESWAEGEWHLGKGIKEFPGGGYPLYDGRIGKVAEVSIQFIEVDREPFDPDDFLGRFKVSIPNLINHVGVHIADFSAGSGSRIVGANNNPAIVEITGDDALYRLYLQVISSNGAPRPYFVEEVESSNMMRLEAHHQKGNTATNYTLSSRLPSAAVPEEHQDSANDED